MPAKKSVLELHEMKRAGQKIAWLTAYDYPTATFEETAGVDMILVGDSLGMCVYGYPGTVPVTMDQCIVHCEAVRRGAPKTLSLIHISEPTRLGMISYAVFCLKK